MTVVGTFRHPLQAEDAIRELQRAGIDRNNISLLAQGEAAGESSGTTRETGAGAGAGAALGGIAGLLLGFGALAIPGIGPVIAAGPIAAALTAGGVGALAGGIMGALTGLNIPEDDARYYAEEVRRGSALVVVRTNDQASAERAREVMDRFGGEQEQPAAPAEVTEIAASSRPEVPQIAVSGARLYDVDGLEFDPVKSRFEDFGKP